MDEKRFLMGLASKAKVLCRRGRRNPRVTHYGKLELVTIIETVCKSGIPLRPFVINKGAGHYLGWYRNLSIKEEKSHFYYSSNGWTANFLALKWLRELFDPKSAEIIGDINLPQL
jgi:hypothetical protein